MAKALSRREELERALVTTYRKRIWNPFIQSIKDYQLIQPNDHIAVCISGGKDSMLLALLLRRLQKYSEIPFSLTYLVMDPGYNQVNRQKIEENARLLDLPITVFSTNIFRVADRTEKNPCYLCAKMRRGHLYHEAQKLGCNKIALGHHFNDVIETTVLGMFYGSQLQAMLPKLHSQNFLGMELIRPLYCVHEDAIIAWRDGNELSFLQCACRLTERIHQSEDGVGESKRQEVKALLATLKKTNPNIEKSIFRSIHTASLDTMVGFKIGKTVHSFLEFYDRENPSQELEKTVQQEKQAP